MDSGSDIVRFHEALIKPACMRPCLYPQLLHLNAGAAWSMSRLISRFKIAADGRSFDEPPTPEDAKSALREWLDEIAVEISEYKISDIARDAVFPVPDDVDYDATDAFWVSQSLPPLPVLLHVLWSIGISSHAVTGAALLWHRASHPLREKTRDLMDDEHETSDFHREAVKA